MYVGAIAILFIFVLKLLNIRLVELRDNATRYVPVGLIMGLVMYIGLKYSLPPIPADVLETTTAISYAKISSFTNIELLGLRLFDDLGFFLILAGYILLLAMVGAIVLTLGHEGEIKRQDIFEQVSRTSQVL
ncbi:MAG: NADH-quinone oxidoreductase subunit J [Ignavibacteriaceae bacterium]|nr:NADH-quinone oxidoreductase subunit J [Ignavibacteriaceae bacterium]